MKRAEIIQRLAGTRYDHGYMTTHALRYERSLEAIGRHVPPNSSILDVGWPTIFTDLLTNLGHAVFNAAWDIRDTWPREDRTVPVVLLMQVVEHLKDPATSAFDAFTYEGLTGALNEVKRVLKPGGIVFISTPNLSSAESLKRLISGGSPMRYNPHVREYAASEIEWWVQNAGLKVIEVTTASCYEDTDPAILDAIGKLGGKITCRDDTTFLFATTP